MTSANDTSNTCDGHCPQCDQNLDADVVASESRRESWNQPGMGSLSEIDTYQILRCRGCKTLYVQRMYWFSESQDPPYVTDWPSPPAPDWVDQLEDHTLRNLLHEVYGARNAGHRVLAAIGARAALDRAMVLNGAEGASFKEKLKTLREKGVISETEKRMLGKLTDAGSAAAHRGWSPKREELTTLIDGMKSFLHRTLVLKSAVNAISHPSRPKKSKGISDSSRPPR